MGLLGIWLCCGGHGLPHTCGDKVLHGTHTPASLQSSPLPGTSGWNQGHRTEVGWGGDRGVGGWGWGLLGGGGDGPGTTEVLAAQITELYT